MLQRPFACDKSCSRNVSPCLSYCSHATSLASLAIHLIFDDFISCDASFGCTAFLVFLSRYLLSSHPSRPLSGNLHHQLRTLTLICLSLINPSSLSPPNPDPGRDPLSIRFSTTRHDHTTPSDRLLSTGYCRPAIVESFRSSSSTFQLGLLLDLRLFRSECIFLLSTVQFKFVCECRTS